RMTVAAARPAFTRRCRSLAREASRMLGRVFARLRSPIRSWLRLYRPLHGGRDLVADAQAVADGADKRERFDAARREVAAQQRVDDNPLPVTTALGDQAAVVQSRQAAGGLLGLEVGVQLGAGG